MRLALLDESSHPLFLIFGGEEDPEERSSVAEAVFLGHVEAVDDGFLA